MLITGNQLKAARALADIDQHELANLAGINVNTIRNMEARGAEPITSSAVTIRKVQLALEVRGIEFLNHAHPGVRLSTPKEGVTKIEAQITTAPRDRRATKQSKRLRRKI
jgi:transcriptional regulator with XRE-family HTH domain